jgi:hypothetical protein
MQFVRLGNYLALGLSVLFSGTLQAQAKPPTVRFEVTSRTDAFDGTAFDKVGVYEQVTAIAHMKIDPGAPANRGIVDLDGAPRDADGLVQYDIDVQILRPRDSAKARRVMVYDVVNRGNKGISAMRVGSAKGADAGAIFLAQRGYTIVWSGWQGDISSSRLIGARFPVATDHGRPITGRISSEAVFDAPTGDQIALPYSAASLDQSNAQLTVRQRTDDREQTIAPGDWRFDDERHVTLKRPADMDAGAIYRFSYVARDPKVMGLGFAAVRDVISFLRHGEADQGNPLADIATATCERNARGACANPVGGVFSTTVAFGASQSGRYLRDFLWQGFNRDSTGSRVFDGMLVMIAGGRRTFTNMRFAEPGRFSRQHEDHDVPGFDFPFAYGALRDPVTGKTDGILSRCQRDQTCPKVFHVDTSAEFWQAGASLVGTGGTDKDVPFPETVHAFMIAGGAHAPGMATPACQSPANPMNYTPIVHALLIDLVDWTTGSQDPPASRWPRVADGALRPLESLQTPDLQSVGISWPKVVNRPMAPGGMHRWPVLVPSVDADGNDVPGIRMPEMAAPTGTYLAWNLRKAGFAPGDLCVVFGSYVPFAHEATGGHDPRVSLADRYGATSREERLHAAVEELSRDRLLLIEDASAISPPLETSGH